MDKERIIEKYKKEEDRLLISKLFDKILLTEKQNKIQTTDFLTPLELKIVQDVLNTIKYTNYEIFGGTENAQRKMVIIYPDKLENVFNDKTFDYNSICNCIRIKNNAENYEHKIYLGGIIKLGIKREKIGDIVVSEDFADVIVCKEISKFLVNNLKELTRFKNSEVEVIDIGEVTQKEQEFKDFKIIVSSLRLDNIVAELAKTSRNKAIQLLDSERVFVNYQCESKPTKSIKCNDLITIRGTGKFIIDGVLGNTKNGKFILEVKKYL